MGGEGDIKVSIVQITRSVGVKVRLCGGDDGVGYCDFSFKIPVRTHPGSVLSITVSI